MGRVGKDWSLDAVVLALGAGRATGRLRQVGKMTNEEAMNCTHLFCAALADRAQSVVWKEPRASTLQVEVKGGRPSHFFVALTPGCAGELLEGVAAGPRVWLSTSVEDVEKSLTGGPLDLEVIGEVDEVEAVFTALRKATARSPLDIRLSFTKPRLT